MFIDAHSNFNLCHWIIAGTNMFKRLVGGMGGSKSQKTSKDKGPSKGQPSGKGKGKETRQERPSGNPGGPNRAKQTVRRDKLTKRAIRSTKFYHQPTCDRLGIATKVLRMADRLGWHQWIHARMPGPDG